jgi:hypothetical protein
MTDDEYMIDMFSAAELRAYDYGCKESMDAFTRLLDGKGSRDGVCQPQWQALRARVWKLMDASPPALSAEPFSPKEIALMNEKWLHRKALGLAEAAPSAEPVAWIIDWPDEPNLGHYFAEKRDDCARTQRSRPLYTTAPDHLAAMQQALEALEERYIGALRDSALDALRAALGEK